MKLLRTTTSYNNALINFMFEKNNIIKKATGIEMLNEQDKYEILSWPEHICKGILQEIAYFIKHGVKMDCQLCPWCVINAWCVINGGGDKCRGCMYGERHGNCDDDESLYDQIQLALGDCLIIDDQLLLGKIVNAFRQAIKDVVLQVDYV